jgi:hypothetical protein
MKIHKQPFKGYDFEEGEEIVGCNHCLKKSKFFVKFHYEDRPKKGSDNHIVIPLELIKTKCYDLRAPALCGRCKQLPRCKDCDVILCNWKRHDGGHSSKFDSIICDLCQSFKDGSYPQIK